MEILLNMQFCQALKTDCMYTSKRLFSYLWISPKNSIMLCHYGPKEPLLLLLHFSLFSSVVSKAEYMIIKRDNVDTLLTSQVHSNRALGFIVLKCYLLKSPFCTIHSMCCSSGQCRLKLTLWLTSSCSAFFLFRWETTSYFFWFVLPRWATAVGGWGEDYARKVSRSKLSFPPHPGHLIVQHFATCRHRGVWAAPKCTQPQLIVITNQSSTKGLLMW